MAYAMKPLACDPTRIKGMSEKLIASHYENNYVGAGQEAGHPVGNGPHDDVGRRPTDPRPRYVRALLSHGLRRAGGRLCRCVHGGDQLAECRSRLRRVGTLTLGRISELSRKNRS